MARGLGPSVWIQRFPQLFGLIGLWILLLFYFAVWVPHFYGFGTLGNILQFSTILALVTLGQCLVILAGGAGIDLSVGGIVSLAGTVMAFVAQTAVGTVPAIVICLLFGALLGSINGILVVRFKILPLIATLGTFFVFYGLAQAITGGAPQAGFEKWFAFLGRQRFGHLPIHFLGMVLPAFAMAYLVLTCAPLGRWIYAMGCNELAARLTGIHVSRVRFGLYVLSGMLSATAALVANAWLMSARPDIGYNLELESLTAALLGGVSIFGGKGNVIGVLAAVLFIVTLKTGLQLAGVNSVWQMGLVGLMLILSVFIEQFQRT